MKFTTFASVLSFVLAAGAANVEVDVGEDGLTFDPPDIKCNSGDTVTFHFYPGGHSVVSSDFSKPCQSNGQISSGTINSNSGESNNVFVVNCPGSATYLFCSQFSHCKSSGMVAAINAPSSGNTLAAYKAAAKNGADNGPVAGVKGGTVTTAGSAGSSSGGSSTAAATASGTAAPSPSTPAAATGNDGSTSHASSIAVVVFVALVNAFLMA